MTATHAPVETGGLRAFLNRGGFWRLVPVIVVYLALYLGCVRGKVSESHDDQVSAGA